MATRVVSNLVPYTPRRRGLCSLSELNNQLVCRAPAGYNYFASSNLLERPGGQIIEWERVLTRIDTTRLKTTLSVD
jgi:hypothetical protein